MSEVQASAIPELFESRKRKILAELSVPDAEYTDLSPKGSVDEGIRDLIQDINGLPGLVTTSSCAGRISVFLEGRKKQLKPQEEQVRQFVASGGKGAGKWLYVSHDPLQGYDAPRGGEGSYQGRPLHKLFGMVPGDGKPPGLNKQGKAPRLVRFHFEPLILHIMTATLHHAHPVLSAASSSGFRESGLQSLRCLEGDDGTRGDDGPSPIVAVRSAGLSLESVIGYCEDGDANDSTAGNEPIVHSLVTEEYLQMLVAISNERFSVNTERKERFRENLLDLYSASQGAKSKKKTKPPGWEDAQTRRERMRAEGLLRKQRLQDEAKNNEAQDTLPWSCDRMD
ncbi:methyltransferase TYW3-domain-containing protein [Aspergillus alliaceus]|uniref:tRNA(Phe) 7-[(3-amino-3-carboxypropyl)-4-demethylwyosine(37)-N(4)]-methyltransferase n=1 Tax=Petromyces alliaceus TaxID=209559 RepID=A0A5N7C1S1_PETAA|nr:methyltransferase TYW3-domain-containing protein [Aspergillus alliaceus]